MTPTYGEIRTAAVRAANAAMRAAETAFGMAAAQVVDTATEVAGAAAHAAQAANSARHIAAHAPDVTARMAGLANVVVGAAKAAAHAADLVDAAMHAAVDRGDSMQAAEAAGRSWRASTAAYEAGGAPADAWRTSDILAIAYEALIAAESACLTVQRMYLRASGVSLTLATAQGPFRERAGVAGCRRILVWTSRCLPATERGRFFEEWTSDLHALPGRWARIRFTFLLVPGIGRMAIDLRRKHQPGHGPATPS